MKPHTLSSPFLVALLTGAVLLALFTPGIRAGAPADERPVAPAFPAGIVDAYRTLSESIRAEDVGAFMRLFHLEFLYEALDGSGTDRGPWRRLWLDRFADLTYEKVAFEPVKVLEEDDERVVVSVRCVTVVESLADASRRLEETIFQDTWVKSDDAWEIEFRVESKVLSRGAVADGGGRTISSPRVKTLADALRRGEESATSAFWTEVRSSGAPLVEAIPGDADHRWVTFLWRGGGRETRVGLRGGLPSEASSKPLARLGKSDVWYRSERIPANARFTYGFELAIGVEIPAASDESAEVIAVSSIAADPFNPRSLDGSSVVELPEAPAIPWLASVEGRPRGEVERHTVSSAALDERRFVTVYTPPGYGEPSSPCAAAFVIDNGTYASRRVAGTVLDNLIAEKKIPPVVLFMVHGEGSRSETLEASEASVRFLGDELVAWARESFHIHRDARRCLVGGNGLGGLLAAATAIDRPETFGSVLVENGSFSRCVDGSPARSSPPEETLCIPRRLALADELPLRFFLAAGSLEAAPVVDSSRHLRDVLDARGYSPVFRIVAANQHATTWQDALARGLMAFLKE